MKNSKKILSENNPGIYKNSDLKKYMISLYNHSSVILQKYENILEYLSPDLFNLIIADPPYNTTALKWDKGINTDQFINLLIKVLKPDGVLIIFSAQPFTTKIINSGLKYFRYELIWEKNSASNFLLVNKRPMPVHENILIFKKSNNPTIYNPQKLKDEYYNRKRYKGEKLLDRVYHGGTKRTDSNGDTRYPRSVLSFSRVEKPIIPTQKPIELIDYLIRTYSNENSFILDPCAGSETVGEVCIKTGRKFLLIEKNKKHFDLINNRLSHACRQLEINY